VNREAGSDRTGFAVRRHPAGSSAGRWWRILAVLAVVATAVVAGWWLLTGDLFAVAQVETGGYRFTERSRLESCLESLLGRNIWTLKGSDVTVAMADLPWVREVDMQRHLPNHLYLDLREWRPLVTVDGVGDGTRPRVLVGDGRVLAFPESLVAPALPVLVGVAVAPDSTGVSCLPPHERDQVLALLAAVESTGLEAHVPVDFVVAREQGYAIVLAGDAGTLLVGREHFARRLERYMMARDHLDQGLEVDLRFRDRVTVRRRGS